jgi:TrmH family RNA methyltransferase
MLDRITSIHNPRIRKAVRLRVRDERENQRRSVIDGHREISHALNAGVEIIELFVCEESLDAESRPVVQQAAEHGVELCYVSPAVSKKLSFGDRDQGLVATFRPPGWRLEGLCLPAEPLVAVLVGVEKPGNLGAVMRSADATGVNAVIVADGRTDAFNPNAIRASLGTIFALPVISASSSATLNWLRDQRIRILATRVDGGQDFARADFSGRTAVVLGSEAAGLGALWSGSDVVPVTLPMLGVADSLNVSVTAGVLFYEALRQRRDG